MTCRLFRYEVLWRIHIHLVPRWARAFDRALKQTVFNLPLSSDIVVAVQYGLSCPPRPYCSARQRPSLKTIRGHLFNTMTSLVNTGRNDLLAHISAGSRVFIPKTATSFLFWAKLNSGWTPFIGPCQPHKGANCLVQSFCLQTVTFFWFRIKVVFSYRYGYLILGIQRPVDREGHNLGRNCFYGQNHFLSNHR